MKKILFCLASLGFAIATQAQTKPVPAAAPMPPMAKEEKSTGSMAAFNPDEKVVTEHVTTIKGQKVPFQATTGTMPVWDEDGKAKY